MIFVLLHNAFNIAARFAHSNMVYTSYIIKDIKRRRTALFSEQNKRTRMKRKRRENGRLL